MNGASGKPGDFSTAYTSKDTNQTHHPDNVTEEGVE